MGTNEKKWRRFIRQMYIRFQGDNVSALSAQLSFFLLLALFPFILFLLNVLSFTPIPSSALIGNITEFLPAEVSALLQRIINEMIDAKSTGLLSVGAVVTIWSASRGVSAVSFALNKAYDKKEGRPFWKVAAIMMIFTVAIAVMVLAALLFLIFGEVLARDIFSCVDGAETFTRLWRILRYVVPLIIMLLLFSLLYKFVPNCQLKLRHVLPGAMVASFGWAAASLIFSIYVNDYARYTRIYGSIGGIIILLLWLYLSSMIVILGGELNATLHYFRTGQHIDQYETKILELPRFLRWLKRKK